MRAPSIVLVLSCLACSRNSTGAPPASSASSSIDVPGARNELVFTGMCDASGAVPLTDRLFAVADDEDNVLRVYDANRGGAPIFAVDVSSGLHIQAKKKKKDPSKTGKTPESDIEAATRVGDLAFWITSHARNSSGKLKQERLRFFATTAPKEGAELQVVGSPYEHLLNDLLADPRFAAFDLAAAAERAPKEPGGLNIEGLTERVGGGVFIGFRNPTPQGKALILALHNPEQVVRGERPVFGDPQLIDLGGLGIRSLSWWHGRYLIVAGHYAGGTPSQLFAWNGVDSPKRLPELEFSRLNPEGFFTPETRDDVMLLSDDGALTIDGVECKRLKDSSRKRFRGVWVSVPPAQSAG